MLTSFFSAKHIFICLCSLRVRRSLRITWVDREGMATEFLSSLHAEGRGVITILQTNQYRDLSSFSDVGTFVPLSTDTHGQVIREWPRRASGCRVKTIPTSRCAYRWR